MKLKSITIFGISGGLLGFVIHLAMHHLSGVSVFSIGLHAIQGTAFSLVGIAAGVLIGILFFSK